MDGPSRKPTILVQRAHVPNRLSQQTLLGVYDRLLRVLARHEERREDVPEPAISEPVSLSTTGGPS
jgi:hypothetical protein